MIERTLLTLELAEALSRSRPDIALGVAKVVGIGLQVFVVGTQSVLKEQVSTVEQRESIKDRFQPDSGLLKSEITSVRVV